MTRCLEISADDPDPAVGAGRGINLVPSGERAAHAPDRHVIVLDGSEVVARCSCWWTDAPQLLGDRFGIIGHYAAADRASGAAALERACEILADAGCTLAAGPMDGTTWRRYRFIVERGEAPPFFLEPDNPDDWPGHWTQSGFSPLATYTSAAVDDLAVEDARTDQAREHLESEAITVRTFDPARPDDELRRIFGLSLIAFSRNFLFTPISEAEFMTQNRAVLPFARPELILLAERGDELLGFMFAVPDMLQGRRGEAIDTVVLKTMAVHPSARGLGLGGLLMDDVQRAARRAGFSRAIHALMHEQSASLSLSARYAHTIRRYALFSRPLAGS